MDGMCEQKIFQLIDCPTHEL